ncbi:DUF1016 N-terminal domain-containing protein [Neisseria chenwenguii]|uniref:DUF1016 N-terminal domain-containing protein n=1 Tax=Neisseria chenwenguii TaxID=1853278 RepID=UPI0018F48D15|nr:DUF1016 N-terminal domain-containing protein [Neisseria chenwenguii]
MGRLIIEYEQQGKERAAYGKAQLQRISEKLTKRVGKGFDVTNLRNMRAFYLAFPIRETLSLELSWSHYNRLAKIENLEARQWYAQETISQNWSVRALDRQISKLYYERLLAAQNRALVEQEATAQTQPLTIVSIIICVTHISLIF